MKSWADELRERVREYQFKHKLSQDDIAKRVNRTHSLIQSFLAGRKFPREETVNALVDMVREDHPEYGGAPSIPSIPSTQSTNCLACGHQTPLFIDSQRLKFCAHCGKELGKPCPNCRQLNLPQAKFCMACTAPLETAPIPKPKRSPTNTRKSP